MGALRFGIFSFARAPYGRLRDTWQRAEELGLDSAWTDDGLNTPGYSDFEPWTLLAAQIVTVDHLSGGRVNVGMGTDGPPTPYGAYGHADWPQRERAERLAEQVAILRGLLRSETVNADGPYYPVRDAQVPPPLQKPNPPIIIAAHGDRGFRTVARYADGWNSLGGQPYPDGADPDKRVSLQEAVATTRRRSERLDEICQELGRDPATIRRSIAAIWPVPDPLTSLDAFDEFVGSYQAIGIDEIIFYWPPIEHFRSRAPLSTDRWAMLERIAEATGSSTLTPHQAPQVRGLVRQLFP